MTAAAAAVTAITTMAMIAAAPFLYFTFAICLLNFGFIMFHKQIWFRAIFFSSLPRRSVIIRLKCYLFLNYSPQFWVCALSLSLSRAFQRAKWIIWNVSVNVLKCFSTCEWEVLNEYGWLNVEIIGRNAIEIVKNQKSLKDSDNSQKQIFEDLLYKHICEQHIEWIAGEMT